MYGLHLGEQGALGLDQTSDQLERERERERERESRNVRCHVNRQLIVHISIVASHYVT